MLGATRYRTLAPSIAAPAAASDSGTPVRGAGVGPGPLHSLSRSRAASTHMARLTSPWSCRRLNVESHSLFGIPPNATHSRKAIAMRSYPRNSPEAAARILALVLISDGHVCSSEFAALQHLDAVRDLGLDPRDLPGIVQTLCEDLLMDGFDGGSILSYVDDGSLASVMAEVDEPEMQGEVLRIAAAAVNADKHLSEGEVAVVDAVNRHWGNPSV